MALSGKRLDDDDLLIDAETVKHAQQVLSTARHLSFHRQTEVFLHSFSDSTSHGVMSEKGKKDQININLHVVRHVLNSDILTSVNFAHIFKLAGHCCTILSHCHK